LKIKTFDKIENKNNLLFQYKDKSFQILFMYHVYDIVGIVIIELIKNMIKEKVFIIKKYLLLNGK